MPTTYYEWDPNNDNIIAEYDENGNVIVEYTTEPGLHGAVISEHRNGQTYYHHHDGMGNTVALTNDQGDVTDTIAYTANGEVTERTGNTPSPYQYKGEHGYYTDHTTGEVMVRRRDYDPRLGRWLSTDPIVAVERQQHQQLIGELQTAVDGSISSDALKAIVEADARSTNPFWHAANNPVMATDPSGQFLGFNYGKYCGYSRYPGFCPAPPGIDALDDACGAHDCCIRSILDILVPCRVYNCDLRLCQTAQDPNICNGASNKAACTRAKTAISLWMCNPVLGTTPIIYPIF
jgi:RHS repeat-associated protein